jgi:hypothetical protein
VDDKYANEWVERALNAEATLETERAARRAAEREYLVLRGQADKLEAALNHMRSFGGACPCGAWFGDESERPHVIGCPVGAAFEGGDK